MRKKLCPPALYRGVGNEVARHPMDLTGLLVTQCPEVASKYGSRGVIEYEGLNISWSELLTLGTGDLLRIARERGFKNGEELSAYFRSQGYKAVRYPDLLSGDNQIVVLDLTILKVKVFHPSPITL